MLVLKFLKFIHYLIWARTPNFLLLHNFEEDTLLWKMVPVSFLYDDMCRNNNEWCVFFVHDCKSKWDILQNPLLHIAQMKGFSSMAAEVDRQVIFSWKCFLTFLICEYFSASMNWKVPHEISFSKKSFVAFLTQVGFISHMREDMHIQTRFMRKFFIAFFTRERLLSCMGA